MVMRGSRSGRRALVALLAPLLAAACLAPGAAAASPTACRVRDVESGTLSTSLQAAVDAAAQGHHLFVRGSCHGLTTIARSLTIRGVRTRLSGPPTLDGDLAGGAVLTVQAGVTLVLRGALVARDGVGWGQPGGGLLNLGVVELRDTVRFTANQYTAVQNQGVLRMFDHSQVRGNTGGMYGGGVYNGGTLVMRGESAIRGNAADSAGGILNANGTVRILDRASVRGNRAVYFGGGITNSRASNDPARQGVIVVSGHATIRNNVAGVNGGGVANWGMLTLRDAASITGNTASGGTGGGLWIDGGTQHGVRCAPSASANVLGNTPDDCATAPPS
jgi:hypothetical protein